MKDSKSRSQREQFEVYLKLRDESKDAYKKTYGIDYEKDILDWLTGQTAMILNAGSAKKGPEFLAVTEINDKAKVEESIKKLSLPNSRAQINDRNRISDLRSIVTALKTYYVYNYQYPTSIKQLVDQDLLYSEPKDPVTDQSYSYTKSSDSKNFTLSVKLDDGRTLTYTATGTANYTGTKKDLTIKPVAKDYNGTNIYELELYSYEKITYKLYLAVSAKLAILGFSDSDSSYKQILDFEKNGTAKLSENSEFKSQFENKSDEIQDLSFIEPINAWGFVEYLTATYPEYKKTAAGYSGVTETYFEDIEKATKGYLRTVPSIGTSLNNKDGVTSSKTFVKVTELPSKDKTEAEAAMERLLKMDDDNEYQSVLGINTETFAGKVKKSLGSFYQEKVRAFISPSLLSN